MSQAMGPCDSVLGEAVEAAGCRLPLDARTFDWRFFYGPSFKDGEAPATLVALAAAPFRVEMGEDYSQTLRIS